VERGETASAVRVKQEQALLSSLENIVVTARLLRFCHLFQTILQDADRCVAAAAAASIHVSAVLKKQGHRRRVAPPQCPDERGCRTFVRRVIRIRSPVKQQP
jgi:hypothetical protein